MPVYEIPEEFKTEELMKAGFKGVFYGGCVARGEGSSFRAKAHAHCFPQDPYHGWVCYRSAKRLHQRHLLIHELAHIITKNGHTRKFYKCVRRLGGRITAGGRRIAPVATKGV